MTLPEARRTFANLMAKSRGAGLTEPDRRRLAQARQLLRRAKRPAMNPRKRSRRNPTEGPGRTFHDLPKGTKFYFQGDSARQFPGPYYKTGVGSAAPDFNDPYRGTVSVNRRERVLVEAYPPPGRNPIELGYRSRKTGRGRHVSIGLERSQRSNPRRKVQRLGRALEVRYKREIGSQPGYYKHAIKSKRAGVYAIPPGWVYVGTKSVLITEKEPHV